MISIIIPSFNERYNIIETLNNLFDHITTLNLNIEYEVIVVDSSNDDTFQILKNSNIYKKNNLRVIHSEKKLFPGEGRNLGIEKSIYDIVVFVDSSFSFGKDWFYELIQPLLKDLETEIIWGITETNTSSKNDRIFAYLVESKNPTRRIIPNMAVRKKVFLDGNWFINDLRAVEDTRFVNQIKGKYNEKFVNATNYYSGYPNTIKAAFKKWNNYSYYSAKAGYSKKFKLSFIQFFLYILILSLVDFPFSVFCIFLLQFFRIITKSNKKYKVSLNEFPYIIFLSFAIDFGRIYGSFKYFLNKKLR